MPFTREEIGEDKIYKKNLELINQIEAAKKIPFIRDCIEKTKEISSYLSEKMEKGLYYSPDEIDGIIRKEFNDEISEIVLMTTKSYEEFKLDKRETEGAVFYKVRDF